MLGSHLHDAVAVGVRVEAIEALRAGREEELTDDERELTEYIRQVRDGRVTDESFAAMERRLGRRGVVEYTGFIMFLVLTIRLIEAFTGATGPTDEQIDEWIREYKEGTRQAPDAKQSLRIG